MDIEMPFVCEFLESLCQFLGVEHLVTTVYHVQMSGPIERLIITTINRLQQYVTEYQRDRHLCTAADLCV